MGRKMKSIAALIIVLGLIYWQQLSIVGADTVLEIEDEGRDNQEKEDEMEKETDEEKKEESDSGDEKPGGDGSEDKDPEGGDTDDKEEPPEPIECFEITFMGENGRNGYYISKPEAEICHVSKRGITRYSFTDGEGKTTEGELKEGNEKVKIEKERFKEGANRLTIWMEDEAKEKIEENVFEKIFLVDTKAPVLRVQTPQGMDKWYQEEAFISVSAEDWDQGSQIDEIICFQGKQEIGRSQKTSAGFRVTLASAGGKAVPVTVSVWDKAGNLAEETVGLYIDCHPPKTVIEGIEPYMITSQPVELIYHVEDENGIENMNAAADWEDPAGEITFLEVSDWNVTDTGRDARQTLTEDGIYRLKVEASDKAGYRDESTGQIMIDKENPVISSVDGFDGKYMKNFCWDEPIEDVIQDFTSYTYSVYLDGKPYQMGENITKEGGHILEVQAVDSAGNEGVAKAEFVIDHTAPEIVFTDVEEGGKYEEERLFQVSLKDSKDHIEEIRINGEKQKLASDGKKNQYHVRECKDYKVSVKASDKAGNQVVSQMNFKVVPEETMMQKVAGPIRKALIGPFKSGKKEQTIGESRQEGRRSPMAGLLMIGVAAAGGGTGFYILKKWL